MSTNITYYVSVDSQYRDDSKFPLETDFGVKFKPSDFYATYPDQSFFYPEIAELYENTGAYNPPGLAPNPSTITGSGIVYPQGQPLQSDQVYPRVTIDKNFVDNAITMVGGNILQMKEVGDTIYVAAVTIGYGSGGSPPFSLPQNTWAILVNNQVMYRGQTSSDITVPTTLVVVATVKKTTSGAYTFGNCLAMNCTTEIDGDLFRFTNTTYLIDMDINTTLDFCYLMFDFKALQFAFQRIPAVDDLNQSDANLPVLFKKDISNPNPAVFDPNHTANTQWSNVMIVGFKADLSGLYTYNNAPWGYHQFYTFQNYEMMPSLNGYNQMLTDEAGNIYATVHVSPSQYTRPLEHPKSLNVVDFGQLVGKALLNNYKRTITTGGKNSKPLSSLVYAGGSLKAVMLFALEDAGDAIWFVIIDYVNQLNPPQVNFIAAATTTVDTNDAGFFEYASQGFMVMNNSVGNGLIVFQVTNPYTIAAQALPLGAGIDSVEAVNGCVTTIAATPQFNGYPAVVAVTNEGGIFNLYLFEFQYLGNPFLFPNTLIPHGSITLPSSCYMVNVHETASQLFIYVVTDDSYLYVYRYDAGTDAPVLGSSIYIPGTTVSDQNNGQCSHVTSYNRSNLYEIVLVACNETGYEFIISSNGNSISRNNPISNSSTFNYHFTTPSPGYVSTQEFLLSSNSNNGVSTVWNITLPNKSDAYQVGDYFAQGERAMWFGIDNMNNLHGLSRDYFINIERARYFVTVSPFVSNNSPIAMFSEHHTDPQSVLASLSPTNYPVYADFPYYPNYVATFESVADDYLSSVQQVYVLTNQGKFLILDVTNYPFFNQTSYPWNLPLPPNNVGSLAFNTITEAYTKVSVFSSLNVMFGGTVVNLVANNGVETSYTNSFSHPTAWTEPSILGFGFQDLNSKRGVVTTFTDTTVTSYWADLPPGPASTIMTYYYLGYGAPILLAGTVVQFEDNSTWICLVCTLSVFGPSSQYFYFFLNAMIPFQIAGFNALPLDTYNPPVTPLRKFQLTSSKDPLTAQNNIYMETVLGTNESSQMFTITTPSILGTFPNVVTTFVRSSQVFNHQYMMSGCTCDAAATLGNTSHLAAFQSVENSPSLNVSYYDTTALNNFKLLANFNVDTPSHNLTPTRQVVKIGGFSNRTLLVTLDGYGQAPGTYGTLSMFDVSNPLLAQSSATSTAVYDGFGVGNAFVCKINNDGTPAWGTLLGDFKDVLLNSPTPNLEPTLYTSQFVNVTGLELDPSNLNLYASVDWQTKLMVRNYQSQTGSQRLIRYVESSGGPSVYTKYNNSSVIKFTTSQGYSQYVLPIYGSNSVSSIDIAVASTGVIIGNSLTALTTVLYEKQLPSFNLATLTNPVVYQAVISSPESYTVALTNFDFNGVFKWTSKIEVTDANSFNYGVAMAKTNDSVYIIGVTTSNILNFKNASNVTVQNWTNDVLYTTEAPYIFKPNATYNYIAKYTVGGDYLESDIMQTDKYATMTPVSIFVSESNNIVDVVHWGLIVGTNSPLLTRNKDGTLADYRTISYSYTLDNLTYNSAAYSIGSRYKLSTTTKDVNNKEYSYLTAYKDVMSPFFVLDLFEPYMTGTAGIDFTNRHVYIPQLGENYLIRSASYNATTNEFVILLNQKIATNTINRKMPATIQYPIEQVALFPDRYDTLFFYIANISTGLTYRFGKLSSSTPSSILYYSNAPVDISKQYYLVDSNSDQSVFTVPVKGIQEISTNLYSMTCDASRFFNPSRPTPYAWLTEFNANALYTLQFYPAALNMVEYYTVALQNLTIPNRDIRESTIPGVRNLSDFRYVWLEIYNANDEDVADTEFVNNTFSNNPNRNNKVIFQIPVTSAGGGTNFSFYGSGQTPRIKFNPGFYNLRIRLLDPNGNVVLFDSTPASNNSGDAIFTTTVDPSLMNITVDLALTKYNSF